MIGPAVERLMPIEIDQHGPRGLTFSNGPIVDAEPLGDGHTSKGQTPPQAQEGVATDGPAQGYGSGVCLPSPPAPRRCALARTRAAASAEPREPRAMTAAR